MFKLFVACLQGFSSSNSAIVIYSHFAIVEEMTYKFFTSPKPMWQSFLLLCYRLQAGWISLRGQAVQMDKGITIYNTDYKFEVLSLDKLREKMTDMPYSAQVNNPFQYRALKRCNSY